MILMNINPAQIHLVAEHQHDAPLLCCAFDPSGRFVLAGGRDRGVVCLDVASGKSTLLEGHTTWVGSTVRCGTDLVLTADFAGRVIAWDCREEIPQPRWNIEAHPGTIYALAASADGQRCATGDRDGTVRVWQASDGKQVHEIAGLAHPVYGLAFHPDGVRLLSADRQPQKPRLKLWEFATGKELFSIDVSPLSAYRRVEDIEWGGIRGITISSDGNTFVACGSNAYSGPACALLFDAVNGASKRKLAATFKGFYYSARFHPQGFLLTAGGDVAKGEIRVWNPDRDEALATVPTPGPCTAIDLHPDGRSCVVAQTIGKGSYPDSGTITLLDWSDPAAAESETPAEPESE